MNKKDREARIKIKDKKTEALFIALLIGIAIIASLIFYSFYFYQANETTEAGVNQNVLGYPISFENVTVKKMKTPAVDKDGNGVSTEIIVEAMPGTGRMLVDINNLLFWADTQESIRKAREVAQNLTNVNISNYDLIYHVYANASVVGGPSAGAALTIITIAALENKSLRQDVAISGAINYDGSIGPVGEILNKAKAAKEENITVFLVPLGQSKELTYEEREVCKTYGSVEYCSKEKIPKIIDLSHKVGINVTEVLNITDAMSYFLE